jgi:hypothetical protein
LVVVVQSAEVDGTGLPEPVALGVADGLQLGDGDPPPMIDSIGIGRPPPSEGLAVGEGLAVPGEVVADGLTVAVAVGEADAEALALEVALALAVALGVAEAHASAAKAAPVPDAAVTSTVVAPVTNAITPATNSPPVVRDRMNTAPHGTTVISVVPLTRPAPTKPPPVGRTGRQGRS